LWNGTIQIICYTWKCHLNFFLLFKNSDLTAFRCKKSCLRARFDFWKHSLFDSFDIWKFFKNNYFSKCHTGGGGGRVQKSIKKVPLWRAQYSIEKAFYVQIFCTNVVFYVHLTRKKLPKQCFVQKICTFNVDEIDTWSSFTSRTCNLKQFIQDKLTSIGGTLLNFTYN